MSVHLRAFLLVSSLLLIAAPAAAQYIGDVTFSEPAGSRLPLSYGVQMEFSYKVAGPNGVYIWAYGLHGGVRPSSCTYSGSPVVPVGEGTLTRTFQLTDVGQIDHVRIFMQDAVTTEVLLIFEVPLYLYYVEDALYDITMSYDSPAAIRFGQRLDIGFTYSTGWPAVRISARPLAGGVTPAGYTASGLFYGGYGSGAGTQYFSFDEDMDIDAVEFKIYNVAMVLLDQFYVPVDLKWRERGVSNVVFTPEPPACVSTTTQVRLDFDYESFENVYTIPYAFDADGALLDTAHQPHPPGGFPAGAGSAWTDFTPSPEDEMDVATVRLRTFDLPAALIDVSLDLPARIRFDDHPMDGFDFTPGSTAILAVDEPVNVSFQYDTDWMGGVKIYARPFCDGQLCPDYSAHGSTVLPMGAHTATGWFTLTAPGHVDQVRFQMQDPVLGKTIAQWFEDVDYHFGPSAEIVGVADTPAPRLVVEAVRPNPFNPTTVMPITLSEDGRVRVRVFDARGRVVAEPLDGFMTAGRHELPFSGAGLPSGAYFCMVESGEERVTRRMMLVK